MRDDRVYVADGSAMRVLDFGPEYEGASVPALPVAAVGLLALLFAGSGAARLGRTRLRHRCAISRLR